MRVEKLSPNFTFMELVNTSYQDLLNGNINCAHHPAIIRNLRSLAQDILQAIRLHFNMPVIINSGYRCEELNKRVGGSKTSQHLYGEAADFKVKGVALEDVFEYIKTSDIVYGQCILEPSWIHISFPKINKEFGINMIAEKINGRMKYTKV